MTRAASLNGQAHEQADEKTFAGISLQKVNGNNHLLHSALTPCLAHAIFWAGRP